MRTSARVTSALPSSVSAGRPPTGIGGLRKTSTKAGTQMSISSCISSGELAHAVLFGVYYTFSRRLQQVVQQGLSVRSEWLFAADVDKHSSPMLSAQAGPPLSPSHPFRSPPPLGSRNSFDLRFD